jgi:fructan beta-fructosidase
LHNTKQGYRVFSNPVKELQSIRKKETSWSFSDLKSGQFVAPKLPFSPSQSEWDLELELPEGSIGKYWIELFNDLGERYRIGYDAVGKQLLSDRTKSGPNQFSDRFARSIHAAPLPLSGSKLRLHLLFDVASVEVFAEEGSTVMTELFFPTRPFTSVKLVAEGGDLLSAKGKTWHLERVWAK